MAPKNRDRGKTAFARFKRLFRCLKSSPPRTNGSDRESATVCKISEADREQTPGAIDSEGYKSGNESGAPGTSPVPREKIECRQDTQLNNTTHPESSPATGAPETAFSIGNCSAWQSHTPTRREEGAAVNTAGQTTGDLFTPRLSPRTGVEPVAASSTGTPQEEQRVLSPGSEFQASQDWSKSSLFESSLAVDSPSAGNGDGLSILRLSVVLPWVLARSDWSLRDFEIVSSADMGRGSAVHKAVCTRSGLEVDLRVFQKEELSDEELEMLHRHASMLSQLYHDCLLRFYGAFEDADSIYLLSERSWQADVGSAGTVSEEEAVTNWLHPLLRALVYLRGRGVRIGRLRPESLAWAPGSMSVKYAGLLGAWEGDPQGACELDWWAALTPPEQRPAGEQSAEASDAEGSTGAAPKEDAALSWAVGALAVRLLTGGLPGQGPLAGGSLYSAEGQRDALRMVPTAAASFVRDSLNLDPGARATIGELAKHPFIRGNAPSLVGAGGSSSMLARSSEDSTAASSFAVPRGPSLDGGSAECSVRGSVAETRLSQHRRTMPNSHLGAAAAALRDIGSYSETPKAPASGFEARRWTIERHMEGLDAGLRGADVGSVAERLSSQVESMQATSPLSGDAAMEGASLFLPSRGLRSHPTDDVSPLAERVPRREMLRKLSSSNGPQSGVPRAVADMMRKPITFE
mmetsp:Transcript_36010/g.85417  ORF Transcript_36010/g.85417 Transcript_36010/m.85417 type:complete len:690 (+) Transcript_36010:82-2151(+)